VSVRRGLLVRHAVSQVFHRPRDFSDAVKLIDARRVQVHRDFAIVGSHFSFSLLESILNVRLDSYAALLPVNAAYSA
jgi:hypothetical protein